MNKPVIILGAGRIGQAALDIFVSNSVIVYCFLDDDKSLHGTEINDVSVLGSMDDDKLLSELGQKAEAFVATDENKLRASLVDMLKDINVMPINAIHDAAQISSNAHIGNGNFIDAGTIINSGAKVSNHTLLMSGCIIDHDVNVGDYSQVGIGSMIGAGVEIGKSAFIGSGVTIVPGITIGKNARLGAGSVVIESVKDNATVFGNPAAIV